MTPKTQSVCKHCHHPIDLIDDKWHSQATCCPYNDGRHEPVAEPASTGEPPLKQCPSCNSTERGFCTLAFTGVEHLHNGPDSACCKDLWHIWPAARPSGPSAPPCDCSAGKNARLYEHHRDCHWLQFVTRTKEEYEAYRQHNWDWNLPKWADLTESAAPQTSAEPHPPPGVICTCPLCCPQKYATNVAKWNLPAPQPVSGIYVSETKPHKVDDARIAEIFNPEPVSGDAPQRKANWLTETLNDVSARQARIKAAEADDYMYYAPVSGDAPKVARQIANSIIGPLLHVANNGKKISLNFLDEVALETEALLRPYFPQTPQISADEIRHLVDCVHIGCNGSVAAHEGFGHPSCIACKVGLKLATPASTARTDGPVTELLIKLRAADAMARVADDWIERGQIGSRSALADARLDYGKPFTYEFTKPAAPGSVPQAPKCNCIAMALSGNGPMSQTCQNPNCQYYSGVPQAEPPK